MTWQDIIDVQRSWTKEDSLSYRLNFDDAVELYQNAPLHDLMQAAHQRRMSMNGSNKVTFLVDVYWF